MIKHLNRLRTDLIILITYFNQKKKIVNTKIIILKFKSLKRKIFMIYGVQLF